MAYLDLNTELKPYLGIAVSNTNDDALLTAMIASAQQAIENEVQRRFEVSADSTRYFTPGRDTCEGELYFDEDLAQITSVVNGDGVTITSVQYALIDRNRTPYYAVRLKASYGLYWTYTNDPEDAIAVTGRWGWSVTPDGAIKHVCKRIVGFLYRGKDAQTYDHTAFSELGVIRIRHQIPQDIIALLDPYRRMS